MQRKFTGLYFRVHYVISIAFLLLINSFYKAQIFANLVNNGSFEKIVTNCLGPPSLSVAANWSALVDSAYVGSYMSNCNVSVPFNGSTYQYPRSGNAYVVSSFYSKGGSRGYLLNHLRQPLEKDRTYCVTFHVNISNLSPYAIDGFGAYLGDSSLDTITYCNVPLTYLDPQVKNSPGVVISDTLNWVTINGAFTANGNEKYLLLGNFMADDALTLDSLGGPYYPQQWTDVCIDDVSCVDVETNAWAGPDKMIMYGDSVYVGRENDPTIDPYCTWYEWPWMDTLSTMSGIWVKPVITATYIVKQNLPCGTLKWDTVIVYVGYTGMDESKTEEIKLTVYPYPANEHLVVEAPESTKGHFDNLKARVYNNFGQMVREEDFLFNEGKTEINTADLPNGIYLLNLMSKNTITASKRFIVNR